MVRVTDGTAADSDDRSPSPQTPAPDSPVLNLPGSAAVTVLVGVALAWTARSGATPLLIAVAVVQALLAFTWVLGMQIPGRVGALLLAGLAAAGSDVAVSLWPHSRLGALLAVFALAVPLMFVHQLFRGPDRAGVVESLGGTAVLILAEVGLAALLQLRHEFAGPTLGTDVVFATVVAAAAALLAGQCIDMVLAAPRFDAAVPRGLLGVVLSTGVGAAVADLVLRSASHFGNGRAAFVGAAVGALVGLLAVGTAFAEHDRPLPDGGFGRRSRPVLGVLVPVALVCPVALLLCLVIRS